MSAVLAASHPAKRAVAWKARMSKGMLLRVGGLSFKATEAFGSVEILTALNRGRQLQNDLGELGLSVADMLFAQIHVVRENRRLRLGLLELKRAIYNGRDTAAARKSCAGGLTAAIEDRLDAWQSLHAALESHTRSSVSMVEEHVRAGRLHLKTIAALPDFRAGLLTASPAIGRSLDALLQWSGGEPNRKLRQLESTLLSFIYRTSHKTSPFSRLTLVCYGAFTDDTHLVSSMKDYRISTFVTPNLSLLSRARYYVMRNINEFSTLELVLPTCAQREGLSIFYRRRVETLIGEPGPVHATKREFSYSLRITPTLSRILDRLAGGSATVAQLMEVLVNDAGLEPEAAEEYLGLLGQKDLLRPAGLEISMFDPICWARFCNQIRGTADARLGILAGALSELAATCSEYGNADADKRAHLLAKAGASLDDAFESLAPDARAPRPLLYEDATLTADPISFGQDAWSPVVEHLPAVQRLLSLFDPLLPSRLSMRSIFVRMFGAGGICDDVAAFSDLFHDRFFSTYFSGSMVGANRFGTGRLNAQLVPELNQIERAKQRVVDHVSARRLHATPHEIMLPDDLVDYAAEIGAVEQPYLANAFYFQPATIGVERCAVINKVYGGGGSAFSRFDPLFGEESARPIASMLRDTLGALDGPKKVYAEFQASYDTNLNQHAPLTVTEIVLNGESGGSLPDRQVSLSEVSIRHDVEHDRLYLYCARLGVEIVPVYSGMLYPLAMPELQTLLMHFSFPVTLQGVFFPPPEEAEAQTPGFYPRIRFRNVVLERARWMVDLADAISRDPGETDYALIARWDWWRRTRSIPKSCYVRVIAAGPTHPGMLAKQKPFYVDFTNPFCIGLLDKALKIRAGAIHFVEALPDAADAIVTVDTEKRVAECVVELFQEATHYE